MIQYTRQYNILWYIYQYIENGGLFKIIDKNGRVEKGVG